MADRTPESTLRGDSIRYSKYADANRTHISQASFYQRNKSENESKDHSYTLSGVEEMPKNTTVEAECTSLTNSDGHHSDNINLKSGDDEEFETVKVIGNEATEQALQHCKRTVLHPYLQFQKFIGWRRLWTHYSEAPRAVKCCNVAYPILFFMVLVYTCVSQMVTCFSRTQAASISMNITCTYKLVSGTVLRDLVLLTVYTWGAYLFLYLKPEYHSSLIERVFLSCSDVSTRHYLKSLIRKLQVFLVCGCVWMLFTVITSIMRMFSLKLLDPNTSIDVLLLSDTTYIHNVPRFILVISSLFGFFAFDALYGTVVINYVSQCELIIYFLRSINVKVTTKSQPLDEAIKDIHYAHGILEVFNGHLSYMISLSMFIFTSDVISSCMQLYSLQSNGPPLGYAVGICNIIQWSILMTPPIIQAARLTRECHNISRLGMEVSARPFTYKDTPQEALNSFLLYTTSTRYGAKLLGVVIHPKYVAVFFFVFGLFLAFYPFAYTPWL